MVNIQYVQYMVDKMSNMFNQLTTFILSDKEETTLFYIFNDENYQKKTQLLDWLKENPPDYIFRGYYSKTSYYWEMMIGWKNKSKAVIFKMIFLADCEISKSFKVIDNNIENVL